MSAETNETVVAVPTPERRESRPSHQLGRIPPEQTPGLTWGYVSLVELSVFFRQLGVMLHSGIGMVATLETLSQQTADQKLKYVIWECRNNALEGKPLSAGISRYPDVFSALIVSLVRMGEVAGMVEDMVVQVADYLDREIALRNLIRRVTLYPKIVISSSIVIVCFANWVINSLDGQPIYSPLSDWTTWTCLAPWILGVLFFAKLVLPNPHARLVWDRIRLKIPYYGITIHQLSMAKFSRAFAALYRGGIPPHEATLLAADCTDNESIRARILPAAARVEAGSTMAEAFAETGAFIPMTLDMARTGETTGDLDKMLEKLARFYEDDSEMRAVISGRALGVACLLAVGLYVGYIAVTFYASRAASIGVS